MTTTESAPASRLLILNERAGSMTGELEARLRREFADILVVRFDPAVDIRSLITEDALVVVAGGDGTVGHVARLLVDTAHPLGILSLGTFNNFARSVGIPDDIDQAIELIRTGRPRPVPGGPDQRQAFSGGGRGRNLRRGDRGGGGLKELRFGELGDHLRRLLSAPPFHYRLSGDIEGEGSAMSLVFANTPSSGAGLAIGEGTPTDPYLQLSEHVGETRRNLVGRLAGPALLHKHQEHGRVRRFRRLLVETQPLEPVQATDRAVHVYGDASELGQTPVTVEAELGGLHVLMP